MVRNEKGAIYPIVFILTFISLLLLYKLSETYLAQWGYIQAMKGVYEQEIKRLLLKDVEIFQIDYMIDDEFSLVE